jgi:hypothetical protein
MLFLPVVSGFRSSCPDKNFVYSWNHPLKLAKKNNATSAASQLKFYFSKPEVITEKY